MRDSNTTPGNTEIPQYEAVEQVHHILVFLTNKPIP